MSGFCSAPQCDRPTHAGFLCPSCASTLRADLKAVPVLLRDLEITICRQDRLSDPSGRSTDERPLPLRLGPMEARRDLTETLSSWARHTAARLGVALTATDARTCAVFLRVHADAVQTDEQAGDLADEIGYAVIVARRAVDKPLQQVYVGPCTRELTEEERAYRARLNAEDGGRRDERICGHDLYAHPRADDVMCQADGCEAEYPVVKRREWLLEQVQDQLATATELSRALPDLLQIKLTASMIRGYAHRHGDKLPQYGPHAHDRTNAPRYKVGHLIALVKELQIGQSATPVAS